MPNFPNCRCRASRIDTLAACLGQSYFYLVVAQVMVYAACGVAPASHASDNAVGVVSSLFFRQLRFHLLAYYGLQPCNDVRVRVRAYGRADDIKSVGRVAAPIADCFVRGVLQCHVPGCYRKYRCTQHLHFFDVGHLPFHVGLTHIHGAGHTHQGADCGGSHSVLSCPRFGDYPRLAHLFCQ